MGGSCHSIHPPPPREHGVSRLEPASRARPAYRSSRWKPIMPGQDPGFEGKARRRMSPFTPERNRYRATRSRIAGSPESKMNPSRSWPGWIPRISNVFSHHLPTTGDVSSRYGSHPDMMAVSGEDSSINEKTLVSKGLVASCRSETSVVGSTGDGTRTHDLRIMRPPL